MSSIERILVGAGTEGVGLGRAIERKLGGRPKTEVRTSWQDGGLPSGGTVETLERLIRHVTAGILIFVPDTGASPTASSSRDILVLSLARLIALYGRARVALVQVGDAQLPMDVRGINVISIPNLDRNEGLPEEVSDGLNAWLEQLERLPPGGAPRLLSQLEHVLSALPSLTTKAQAAFDRNAAMLLSTTLAAAMTDSQGVNMGFVKLAEHELKDSVSISACDATGPSGWVGPAPYRYIAAQVRQYLYANRAGGGPYIHECMVHPWLRSAMDRAIEKARQVMPGGSSSTRFDDDGEVRFTAGDPRLQYSRILLWTEDELADPMAAPVISLHEAFRIPLFHLPVQHDGEEKKLAYVAFEHRDKEVSVLFGEREHGYDATRDVSYVEKGTLPRLGNALAHYLQLLKRPDLMFAMDARERLLTP